MNMVRKSIESSTIREDFNVYEVETGQILKAKSIVVDVYEDEDKRGKFGNLGFQTISHVTTTTKIDTTDYEYLPTEQVKEEHEIKDLKYKTIKENINIYETKELIILVDPRVEKISLTNKKNKEGNPVLRFRTGIAVSVIPKRPEVK